MSRPRGCAAAIFGNFWPVDPWVQIVSRLDQARVDKILAEHDPFQLSS